MKPDFVNTHNQDNESFTLNKAFIPPYPVSPDTRILSFIFPFILMYYQETRILQLKDGQTYKKTQDYRVVPWKYQVVMEFLSGVQKWKKMVLRHSKMGSWKPCSRFIFSKLAKIITLMRKRWFFSKVLKMQDEQEYFPTKLLLIPISNNILHHILQPSDHNISLSVVDI